MRDVIAEGGFLFLGSRFRRLAERLQTDVATLCAEAGIPVKPGQFALLRALEHEGTQSVGALAVALGAPQPSVTRTINTLQALGLVGIRVDKTDQRVRHITLTSEGSAALMRARLLIWPRVEAAVRDVAGDLHGPLLQQLAELEQSVAQKPLAVRAREIAPPRMCIREWEEGLASEFRAINVEWINAMFTMEPADFETLDNPVETIIAPGGDILFVEVDGVGVVGTCALKKTGPDCFELTKMGVYAAARGLKAGEFLLAAVIRRAREKGATRLYLLSNRRNAAAVHLYEKVGFHHSTEIMELYGRKYTRCDVAMDYPMIEQAG